MSQSRRYSLFSIILIVLVPLLLLFIPLITKRVVSDTYSGIAQDLIVLVIIWALNHYLFKMPIKLWQSQHGWQQLLNCLPAALFLLVPKIISALQLAKLPFSAMILFYGGYVLLIGITEEYCYRGVLLPLLAKALPGKTMLVIILDSLAFGCVHLINLTGLNWTYVLPQLMMASVTGLLLCGVYLKTKNLMLPILLHAFSDINMIVQFMSHTHTRSNLSSPNGIALGLTLIFAVIFLIVAAFVYWQTRHLNIEKQLQA
ncbi:CPBP family intramembrane glutamic endopeptidase [Lactiplantibacillus sp. WILCCON 0030]|uniref:CPBP family intramembrane glutamic endopeptidase n=1 Tax=Lactiplantibacillus brownii TaxID=3069269 RepID=A0ABU1A6X5_9LACO|nr:CPBP family intramembrane glutamic endopeptidase [Lactiplantibacillus brownii]MDQ7936683.1 CPBP family intramembrane glutamic endopeptidase [Lactiplantibacillus brownii]